MASVAKTIEISADSTESFEMAIQSGINKAQDSIDNLKSVWVKDQEVLLDSGTPNYRVKLKATFALN